MTIAEKYWYNRMMNVTARGFRPALCGASRGLPGKQIRPYLRELQLDGYDPQYNGLEVIIDDLAGYSMFGACSSIRSYTDTIHNIGFQGRNFDFIYDNRQTYLIRVRDTDKNFAFNCIVKDMFKAGTNVRKLPNMAVDGINQKGVCVSINVVSKKDLDDLGEGFANVHGTKPDAEKVHMLCVPCLILAKAETAVGAIELMKQYNIYGDLKGVEYVHFMISDKEDTYVVEIIGDQLKIKGFSLNEHRDIETESPDKLPAIMTNWYLCHDRFPGGKIIRGKYTENACGVERYDMLYSMYTSSGKERDEQWTADLMKAVRFTNQATMNPASDKYYPFSDFGWGAKWVQQNYIDNTDGFKDRVDNEIAKIRKALMTEDRTAGIWITSHSVIYSLKEKYEPGESVMSLVFEEKDYDNPMKFGFWLRDR